MFNSKLTLPTVLAILITTLATAAIVSATTIGNNISTDGTLTVTGNTGIGTTSPSQKLSVTGKVYTAGGIQFPDGSLQTAAASAASLSSAGQIAFYNTDGSTVSGTSTLFITPAGNVGIGITNPAQKLDVAGIGQIQNYLFTSYIVSTSTATSTFSGGLYGSLISAPYFHATSTTATSTFAGGAIFATGGGNFGIGTSSPSETLDIIGSLKMDVLNAGVISVTASSTGKTTYYRPLANTDTARGVALQNAFLASGAGDYITIGPGNYLLTTALSVLDSQTVVLQSSHLYHTNNAIDIFYVNNANDVKIGGNGVLSGTGTSTTSVIADEAGIRTAGVSNNFRVDSIAMKNFKGAGLVLNSQPPADTSASYTNGAISNIHAIASHWGIYISTEYWKITNSEMSNNDIGLYDSAGNMDLSNSTIDNNNIFGIYIDNGGNSAHGIVSNSEINHNGGPSVYINQTTNGMTFVGNHIYGTAGTSTITFNATYGNNFLGGIMGHPFTITMAGIFSGYNTIKNVIFPSGEPTIAATITAQQRRFLKMENNYTTTGYSSTNLDAIVPEMGGTGSVKRNTTMSIPVPDEEGNFSYPLSFTRDGAGIFNQQGVTNFTNTATSGLIVSTGLHDNIGLVVRGSNDNSPAPITPTNIANLEFWFKADALALNDGDAVGTWTDSSGNGRNATQATAANKPTFKRNVLNGYPTIRFNGTTTYLDTASVSKTQPLNFFVVMRESSEVSSASGMNRTPFNWGAAPLMYSFTPTTGTIYAGANFTFNINPVVWNLMDFQINGASSLMSVNGGADQTGNAGASNPSGVFRIGEYTPLGTYAWKGDIAEIIVYSGALSAANREGIRRYIQSKYGMALTNGTSNSFTQQSANLQEWQNASSSPLGVFTATGNFGIGTSTPAATLDVNGYMKLNKNTSQPVACGVNNAGAIALSSSYLGCVCNGTGWINIGSSTQACVW